MLIKDGKINILYHDYSIYQCHCTNNIYSRLQLARLNLVFLLFGILELSPFLFSRFNCSVYKYNHIFNLFYFHFGYISRKCASDVMFALWALLISWLNLAGVSILVFGNPNLFLHKGEFCMCRVLTLLLFLL